MSITDELRKYADDLDNKAAMKSEHGFSPIGMRLSTIADKIDEEHERTYRNLTDALHKQEDATRELDEKSVLLPRDADGVPWHIGDRTESGQTIQGMGLNRHGWFFMGKVSDLDPSIHRHYHEPTVEDVLQEFRDAVQECLDTDDTVAEYADRIRKAVAHEEDE